MVCDLPHPYSLPNAETAQGEKKETGRFGSLLPMSSAESSGLAGVGLG